jgi:hypothetical protein
MRSAGDLADYMAGHASTEQEQKAWQDGGTYRVLLHGLVGAATAELGGGRATQGALGAVASEAASGVMANYLADHHIDPNSAEGRTLMELASAAVGGAVGGGAGATTALDGEKYNRQLHPSEQQLAQTLAAKSGGRFTTRQIEDAMRLSGYTPQVGDSIPQETSQEGMLVNVEDSGNVYDVHANWLLIPGPSGSSYLMQKIPPQVSPDVASYITESTVGLASPYAWTPEQKGLPTPGDPYLPWLAIIPDYAAINVTGLGIGGSSAINAHTGQVYAGGSGNVPVVPSISFVVGWLPTNLGESSRVSAANTANFLKGSGINGSACYVLCFGVNHSYGGDTGIEVGLGVGSPAKGVSGSTGVMTPAFNIPFTPGDDSTSKEDEE